MDRLIERPTYVDWLLDFREKPLIKVLTGMRRVGKSTVLELYARRIRKLGVRAADIVRINFEELENAELRDKTKLHAFILSRRRPGRVLYVFLDEIQRVSGYEEVLDSLFVKRDVDLYVTGSTAKLLSSEIATVLTGRYVEINVLPLSFAEYRSAFPASADERKLFRDFLAYGSLPESLSFPPGSPRQREYVQSVFRTILERDVLLRNASGGRLVVSHILRYMMDAMGNLTSPKRVADRINADGKVASYTTIASYLEILEDCFFLYRPERFDVVGGNLLKLIHKYYLADLGFRRYLTETSGIELQQLLENAVYLELRSRRYEVLTGKVDTREVDFVVRDERGQRQYIQVAVTIATPEKLEQELAPFAKISDNYPRFIITLDDYFISDQKGVKIVNAIDFMLRCKRG